MEERRVVSTMQETFIKQIADLSRTVGELNIKLSVHHNMMEEIRDSQKEYRNFAILMERNSNKVEEAMKEVKEVHKLHTTCNVKDVEKNLSVVTTKQALMIKIMGVLGTAVVAALVKSFTNVF